MDTSLKDVCSCCKEERVNSKQAPRKLRRLPISVTQNKLFKKKGLPIRLCPHCDGDALPKALAIHKV